MQFPLSDVADDRVEAALADIEHRIWMSWYEIRYASDDPVAELWGMVDALRDYLGACSIADPGLSSESARIAMRTAAEAAFGAIELEMWPLGDQDIRLLMIGESISSQERDFHHLSETVPPASRWLDAYWLMIIGGLVSVQGGVLAESSAPEIFEVCGDSLEGIVMNALSDYIGGEYPASRLCRPSDENRQHYLRLLAATPIAAGSPAGMLRALLEEDESGFELERRNWLGWYRDQISGNPEPGVLLPLPVIGLTALAVHAHGWRGQAESGWLPAGLPVEVDGVSTTLVVRVPAHQDERANRLGLARLLKQQVAEAISMLEQSPDSIFGAFALAELSLRAQSAAYPLGDSPDARDAAVHALQLGSAMFEITSRVDGIVHCVIAGRVRHIPAIGPRAECTVQDWITTFYLGLICSDQQRLQRLSLIPAETLRSPEVTAEEFHFRWMQALQSWFEDEPEWAEKLAEAIKQSHPDIATTIPRDYLDQIVYQPIGLFHTLHRKDERAFNDALAVALRHHRDYWTADPRRATDIAGDLALGPLALACLAQDCGRAIKVESDYIPPGLLQRDWPADYKISRPTS